MTSDQPSVWVSFVGIDGAPISEQIPGRNVTWEIDGTGHLVLFRGGQVQMAYAPGVWRTVALLPIPD
jgi:hypothetical protein